MYNHEHMIEDAPISQNPELTASMDNSPPRYDLTPEELRTLELELVNEIKETSPAEGITAVWIGPNHKYANILRNHEAQLFPEVTELPQDIEDRSLFLALVDTRNGEDRVVHATTISGVLGRKAGEQNPDDPEGPVTSGFIVIDDLIEMGNFTPEEFWDYYKTSGVNLENAVSVETNFRIGQRVNDYNGFGTADIAYLTVFKLAVARSTDPSQAAVFASINDKTIKSFERVGITCNPIMDRSNLVTSESKEGLDFTPVLIVNDEHNARVFDSIDTQVETLALGVSPESIKHSS